MAKKVLFISILITSILIIYFSKNYSEIGSDDACLCTEILNNESFIDQKDKMPSVKKCIESFKDFENAHLKCMDSFPIEHPEFKIDSLKSA